MKLDEKGEVIQDEDGNPVYMKISFDENGKPKLDEKGKPIFLDENENPV